MAKLSISMLEARRDARLKAFYRLEKKLKRHFPHTRLPLLLDGLYACKEVFNICRLNGWSFIVVFKEGSIPTLHAKAVRNRDLHTENSMRAKEDGSGFQNLSWANNIEYCGMHLHAMFCEDHVRAKDAELTTRWCWLTDIRPCADNIEEFVNIRFSSA